MITPKTVKMYKEKDGEVGRYVLHNGEITGGGIKIPIILKIDTKTGLVMEYWAGVIDGEAARGWWITDMFVGPSSKKEVGGVDVEGGEK